MPHKRAKRSVRERTKAEIGSDLPPSQALYSNDGIPKSMSRILNAESIRKAYREKKRRLQEEDGQGGPKVGKRKKLKEEGEASSKARNELKIKPGETLREFRQRVEDDMRPALRAAMKNVSMSKQKRKQAMKEAEAVSQAKKSGTRDDDAASRKNGSSNSSKAQGSGGTDHGLRTNLDFVCGSTSAPRRLHDIVQAPPLLKPAPRLDRLREKAAETARKMGQRDDGDKDAYSCSALGSGDLSAAQRRTMELEREKAIVRYRALKEAKLGQLKP